MRGNPLTMGEQYFIVGKSGNTYYYMMADPSKTGGVVMYSTNYYNISPSRVTITKSSGVNYSLRTLNGDGTAVYLRLSDGIIDAVSTSRTDISLIDQYNLSQNVLYPGIFYTLSGKLNALTCTSTTTTPLCKNSNSTKVLLDMTIMIIPINFEVQDKGYGTLSLWKNGDCIGTVDETFSLLLFESFIGANTDFTQNNCNIIGPLTTSSNNCPFSSVESCVSRYLYEYTSEECGNNIGVCSSGCRYNTPGSTPVFTCETESNNEEQEGIKTSWFLIMMVVFLFLLIIIYFFYRSSNNSSSIAVNNVK